MFFTPREGGGMADRADEFPAGFKLEVLLPTPVEAGIGCCHRSETLPTSTLVDVDMSLGEGGGKLLVV